VIEESEVDGKINQIVVRATIIKKSGEREEVRMTWGK
jgi:hypothetical protein